RLVGGHLAAASARELLVHRLAAATLVVEVRALGWLRLGSGLASVEALGGIVPGRHLALATGVEERLGMQLRPRVHRGRAHLGVDLLLGVGRASDRLLL